MNSVLNPLELCHELHRGLFCVKLLNEPHRLTKYMSPTPIWLFKGAVCSFEEEIFIEREKSLMTVFLFVWLNKLNKSS